MSRADGLELADLERAAEVVYGAMPPTPQYAWPLLARRVETEVWVKHENHTPVGSFKVRGGLTYMAALRAARPDVEAVIAATRGNHGQSVAFAARRHGLRCTVVVPHGNSAEKNAAMRAFGAELVVYGHDFQDALEHTRGLAEERGMHFVPSYDARLVRGIASYGLELFRAVPAIDTCYVPIGQGSGICAAIAARDALGLRTTIVGVVSAAWPAYKLSFDAGEAVATPPGETIADGVACRVPDARSLAVIRRGAARVVCVTDAEVTAAMGAYYADAHQVAEGAGAAPLAAAMQERERIRGKRVAVVLTGGNVDRDVYLRALA